MITQMVIRGPNITTRVIREIADQIDNKGNGSGMVSGPSGEKYEWWAATDPVKIGWSRC